MSAIKIREYQKTIVELTLEITQEYLDELNNRLEQKYTTKSNEPMPKVTEELLLEIWKYGLNEYSGASVYLPKSGTLFDDVEIIEKRKLDAEYPAHLMTYESFLEVVEEITQDDVFDSEQKIVGEYIDGYEYFMED